MAQPARSWWARHACVAGAVVACVGCGGRSTSNDDSSRAREPDLRGSWAAFAFPDPVGAALEQDGTILSGYGCCVGLERSDSNCCGRLQGGVENRRAEFTIVGDHDGAFTYTADVIVSEDGQRMTGSLNGLEPVAWARLAPGEDWLASDDTALQQAVMLRQGVYDLALSETGGGELAETRTYRVQLFTSGLVPLLVGDLGAFWAGEMRWHDAATTLYVGPVPVTSASLPIALELRFTDSELTTVKATLPSGNSYRFSATREAL